MERHLKPVSLGFFILGLAELLGVSIGFRDTANVALANLVAPFRPLWITERVILLIAIYIFGRWVWGYLLKRFETQLFMIFTTATLAIFLITTVAFSLASLANVPTSELSLTPSIVRRRKFSRMPRLFPKTRTSAQPFPAPIGAPLPPS